MFKARALPNTKCFEGVTPNEIYHGEYDVVTKHYTIVEDDGWRGNYTESFFHDHFKILKEDETK